MCRLLFLFCNTVKKKQDSDDSAGSQKNEIDIGIDADIGRPVMKVGGEDRQLFFVFCEQGVDVIGKGSPDTCCDHNDATFYEHI